jgi:hypothetical protein
LSARLSLNNRKILVVSEESEGTVPFMVQIETVEHVLALVELEVRTPKKALIVGFSALTTEIFPLL